MITNFIKKSKSSLILTGILFLLFWIIKISSLIFHAVSIFEFVLLVTIIGLVPAYWFRKVFTYKNTIGWMTNASILGLFFIPLFFLIGGWLKFNFLFFYNKEIIYSLSVLSVLFIIIFVRNDNQNNCYRFDNISLVDGFFYVVIILFNAMLLIQNFTNYYPRWDEFTYWGLDAKYIFDFNQLRDTSYDVFKLFRWQPSFFTVLIALIYGFYGRVVEQFASGINVIFNLLACLLIYNTTINKSIYKKLLVITSLIIISYTADSIAYAFSLYADTIIAFFLLVFMVILTSKQDIDYPPRRYIGRLFMLLLFAFSFYFIKGKSLFITLTLCFITIVYDIKYWIKNWKKIISRPELFVLLFLMAGLLTSHYFYHARLFDPYSLLTETPKVTSGVVKRFTTISTYPLESYLSYSKQLINQLLTRSPYLLTLWLISLISIVFVQNLFKKKSYLYIYIVNAGFFLTYILAYINIQNPLQSGSLIRYTSIVMYLVPLLLSFQDFGKFYALLPKNKNEDPRVFLTILVSVLVFISVSIFNTQIIRSEIFTVPIDFVEGSYEDGLSEYSNFAKKVLSISGDDSRILIADDFKSGNRILNMDPPALYYRYFLMYNSVGGQYRTTIDNLFSYAEIYESDYVLLLSYDDSVESCGDLFTEGHDYLLRLPREMNIEDNQCIFNENLVYDLSE